MTSVQEANKALVCDFYDMVFNQRQPRRAFERYVAIDYIQHNPKAAQGRESAIIFIERILETAPNRRVRIARAMADGDLICLHIHVQDEPDSTGDAHVDFFRVLDGTIVEHWDVIQKIPDDPGAPEAMFCDGRPAQGSG